MRSVIVAVALAACCASLAAAAPTPGANPSLQRARETAVVTQEAHWHGRHHGWRRHPGWRHHHQGWRHHHRHWM